MKFARIVILSALGLLLICNHAQAWPLTGTLQEWIFEDLRPHDIALTGAGSPWLVHEDTTPDDGLVGIVFTFGLSSGSATSFEAEDPASFKCIDKGPDGKMWITDGEGDRLYHFDPDPLSLTYGELTPFDLPAEFGGDPQPTGLTVASDGKVWFTLWNDYSIGYYDPALDDWERIELPSKMCDGVEKDPGNPIDIAIDSAGYVWFTVNGYAGRAPGVGV